MVWGKSAVLLVSAVRTVIDGDEANIGAGQNHLGVVTYLEVISAQSAHVLDDDCADPALVHHGHQSLPVRAFKVGTGVAIVHKEHGVTETVVIRILLQDGFLDNDGVAVTLEFIVSGEAAVKGCDFVCNS